MTSTESNIDINEPPEGIAGKDAAWARIETKLTKSKLWEIIQDPQRILRVNPYFEFLNWQVLSPNSYRMHVRNLSNNKELETNVDMETHNDEVRLVYSEGLKSSTSIRLVTNNEKLGLLIIDDYNKFTEKERVARVEEVDHSLVTWAQALQSYLDSWHRWSWFPLYRWYITRVWQNMKPMARRISTMLIWITVLEIFAFIMVLIVFLDQTGRI